jgi:hypothetical protein
MSQITTAAITATIIIPTVMPIIAPEDRLDELASLLHGEERMIANM